MVRSLLGATASAAPAAARWGAGGLPARRCAPLAPPCRALSAAAEDGGTALPYRVLGVQQVAIGGLDKGALSALWTGLLGCRRLRAFQSPTENVDEDVCLLGPAGPRASPLAVTEIDLMQPLDAERSPKVHVPALNHIGLWVDDLPAAVEALTARGVRFTPGGIRPGASGHDVTFIHPKGNDAFPIGGQGILIELVQAPPEVVEAYDAQS